MTANLVSGGVDEVFTRTDGSGAFTPLKDALGSAIALADSNGNVQTSYTYDPFGNTSVTGTANGNEFQYTGRENEGTGLYFYRGRYYSPLLGRFINEDPLGFDGGDDNLYAYVFDDPIELIDPSGLDALPMPKPGPVGIGFNLEGPAILSLVLAEGALLAEIITTVQAYNNEDAAYAQETQVFNLANKAWLAKHRQPDPTPPLAGRYTATAGGGGGDGGCYDDDDIERAKRLYPNKSNIEERHHIIPIYLGGAPNGPTVLLNGAYHQLITNAFRRLWPYGQGKPTADQLQRILKKVYDEYPIQPCH